MRIGIDLGGTKIEGIALDDSGKERARVRVATPQGSYEATVDGVAAVVRELEAKVGARCRVGVGHPGAISPATGLIKNANSTRLNGHPLDRDLKRTLERHFHTVFVFSMNDEVVHTGFYPMANYLLGVACHRKAAT